MESAIMPTAPPQMIAMALSRKFCSFRGPNSRGMASVERCGTILAVLSAPGTIHENRRQDDDAQDDLLQVRIDATEVEAIIEGANK